VREKARLEQERHERQQDHLCAREQRDDAKEFPDIDRRARRWREQQRAQRLGLPLALEGSSEGQRPGKRNRNPEDAGRAIFRRPPLLHQRKGEDHHRRHREEQRRQRDLEAADLHRQILAKHEPRGADEHRQTVLRAISVR
jgi:hypothetical protein